MSNVLYRKYRAQNFDELVGQEHITKILKNAVKGDQISHAYLFVGSRGTGKTSTARILAKAVNCKNIGEDGNPCGECDICKSISNGNFLDLIEVDAASNRGIDQIRELKERIEFSPSEGKYKVYIIDEVHMLTNEAFNALLKTLEEPPAHVIFILATTDVHKLPPTILSRCQRYDFRLGNDTEIRNILEDICKKEDVTLDKGALDILVRNAKGSYRDALSLLDVVVNGQLKSGDSKHVTLEETRDILGLPQTEMVNNLLGALITKDSKLALHSIEELEIKGVNLQQFTNFVLEVLRETLVIKISGKDINPEYPFTKDISQKEILTLVNAFLGVERDLKNTTNQILILEMLIPVFCNQTNTVVPVKEKVVVEKSNISKKELINKDVSKPEPVIVQKESEKIEVVCSDSSNISLEELKKNWNKIAEGVKPVNPTLFAFIGTSKPISIDGDTIQIEVPFKFHKDQIDVPNSKQAICSVIQSVMGSPCKLNCTVNDKVKPRMQASADVVLKNLPVVEKKAEEKKEDSNNQDKKNFFKQKKVSADVEAIFAGM